MAGRLLRAWRALPPERRLAVYAALGLFLALFLPWYQETAVIPGKAASAASVTGWGAFSFVEAAVLLVATGVLTLLFHRAEGRAFHLPGGDGAIITVAGAWTCALVVWRIFDKQSVRIQGPGTSISGIEWGIFVALAVGGVLAYAGTRIRAAHLPEPPLPGESPPPAGGVARAGRAALADRVAPAGRAARRRRAAPSDSGLAADSGVAPNSGLPPDAAPAPRRARVPPPVREKQFGPPVVPDDPPTLRISKPARRPVTATEEQLTMPLETEEHGSDS